MAGGPIVLRYTADVSEATAGNAELAKSIDSTADSAKDAEAAAASAADKTLAVQKKAAQQVIQAVRDAARQQVQEWARAALDQGKDADRVARDVSQAYDKIERDAKDAARTVQQSSRSSWGDALEAVTDFRDGVGDTLQSAAQALGQFDGSIGSVGNTISGLAALLPGVGGAIGAAFGGIASTVFQSWQESSQKSAQAISDMYADMKESGLKFVSENYINQAIDDMLSDSTKLKGIQNEAAAAGLSVATVLRAQAGDQDALNSVLATARERYAEVSAQITEVGKSNTRISPELQGQSAALQALIGDLTGVDSQAAQAADRLDLFNQATSQTGAALASSAGQAGAFVSALSGIPRDKTVTISVDDAVAREHLRELGKAINVDMYVTPRTGRGVG